MLEDVDVLVVLEDVEDMIGVVDVLVELELEYLLLLPLEEEWLLWEE